MGYKRSTFPNYRRSSLNYTIGNLAAHTDIGFREPYDANMNYIPASIQGNNSYTLWNETFNETYRYYGYSRYNPFVDAKQLNIQYRPVIDSFTSVYQYFKCLLSTIEGKDLAVWFRWRNRNARSLECCLWLANGDAPNYSASFELYYSSSDSEETAISKCNYLISNATFYIGAATQCNQNSLDIYSYDNYFYLLCAIDNAYVWGSMNGDGYSSITWLTISNETEHYIPEPEPEPPSPSDDPYNPGGYSGGGGGPNPTGTGATGTGGLHDDTSDIIANPQIPTSVSTSSGLFTAYNPNASQLANFANKLWNRDPTTIDDWFRLLFGSGLEAVIGLHLIPVQPDVTQTPADIYVGNWQTGASAPKITNQYKRVDFGSVMLPEYWGNSIDYSPYTKLQLALPYVGVVDVDADDCIGANNSLVYNIDVLSGALCATLRCTKGNLDSVLYQWSGSCAAQLPVTGASYNQMAGNAISTVVKGLSSLAGKTSMASAISTIGSAINTFGSGKGRVEKGGSITGNAGALGVQTPYFIITRPVQSIPSTQQATKGYPANISAHLGDLLGYTELTEVHLHNIPGTKDEVLEIEELLKKGVIF